MHIKSIAGNRKTAPELRMISSSSAVSSLMMLEKIELKIGSSSGMMETRRNLQSEWSAQSIFSHATLSRSHRGPPEKQQRSSNLMCFLQVIVSRLHMHRSHNAGCSTSFKILGIVNNIVIMIVSTDLGLKQNDQWLTGNQSFNAISFSMPSPFAIGQLVRAAGSPLKWWSIGPLARSTLQIYYLSTGWHWKHYCLWRWQKSNVFPDGSLILPELLEYSSWIPGGWQLYLGTSKSSMDGAEPLPRVYLNIIQEMVAPLHHLTPCCTLVAPSLGWDPYQLCSVGLLPRSTSNCAALLAPSALDEVCGSLYLHSHAHHRFIMPSPWSPIDYIQEFLD